MAEVGETGIMGWVIGFVASAFLALIITLVAGWPNWSLLVLFIIFLSSWGLVRKWLLS